MTTPDYLEQVVISPRNQQRGSSAMRWASKRPSIAQMVWATLDALSGLVAGLIAFRWRFGALDGAGSPFLRETVHAPLVAIAYLLLFCAYLVICARLYGLYRGVESFSGLHEQRLTVQATLTAGLLLCGTLYMMQALLVSRLAVAMTVVLSGAMLMTRRMVWRRVQAQRYLNGLETRNVLIVGDGRVGHALRNHMEALPHMGFRFKGFVSLQPTAERERETNPMLVGDVRNCVSVARSLFVDEIYFSIPADKQTVLSVVEEARSLGIDVRVVPDLYDGLAWNAPVEFVGQFPTIPLHRREFPRGAYMMKRALDVTVSSAILLLVSPVLAVIATLVRMDSGGPIFYGAERIGRKGRTFKCWKFRTMVPNADKIKKDLAHLNERDGGVLFKIKDDPRITKIGRKLRKYSLDELPQLYNVLKGDMSLVGPRPPLASEVEKYDLAHLRRLDVLPGITGLWQVEARQDPSFDSYISLDTAYVENWSLMLDFRILARTVGVVLGGTGS